MFANVRNNKIIDFNSNYLDSDIEKIETTKEVYEAYLEDNKKVIYLNGNIVLNPDYEKEQAQKERERLDRLSLTKREVFLALYEGKGITPEQLKAQITDQKALIEFEYATEYYRGNPLINLIGVSLGYTSEELDYLFENRKFKGA